MSFDILKQRSDVVFAKGIIKSLSEQQKLRYEKEITAIETATAQRLRDYGESIKATIKKDMKKALSPQEQAALNKKSNHGAELGKNFVKSVTVNGLDQKILKQAIKEWERIIKEMVTDVYQDILREIKNDRTLSPEQKEQEQSRLNTAITGRPDEFQIFKSGFLGEIVVANTLRQIPISRTISGERYTFYPNIEDEENGIDWWFYCKEQGVNIARQFAIQVKTAPVKEPIISVMRTQQDEDTVQLLCGAPRAVRNIKDVQDGNLKNIILACRKLRNVPPTYQDESIIPIIIILPNISTTRQQNHINDMWYDEETGLPYNRFIRQNIHYRDLVERIESILK